MERENRIAVDGRNCWRHASAQRLSFLVDGAAYFPALAAALERAEHSIVIVGWDLHSRLPLRRQGDGAQEAHDLASLLTNLVTHRRQLHIHLLVWDFAMIFALEREIVPVFRVPWSTPHRLHFRYDAEHPVGACHHQKIVVIDDSIAFIRFSCTVWRRPPSWTPSPDPHCVMHRQTTATRFSQPTRSCRCGAST